MQRAQIVSALFCFKYFDIFQNSPYTGQWSILAILFRPFGFRSPKDFKIISLSNILALSVPDEGYSECT